MPTSSRLIKGTTVLTAAMGLSFGFVALPTVTGPAGTPAAGTPATNKPVTPQVKAHALKDRATTSVAAAGPQTQVVAQASLPKDAAGRPVAPAGRPPVDPALEAGQADDTVVDLPATGDLVGVTWPAATTIAPRATVAVRAMNAKGWQEWQELAVEAVKDDKGTVTKYGTEPLWVDGATRVQVRVAPEAKALLKTASLAAVTSPQTAADAQLTPQSTPGAANAAYVPSVISRAGWGADESLRKGCVPTVNPTTHVVVVHHTAGTNSYSAAQSASIIRGIYAYDTNTLGWCDVAYNMIVDKYGQRFEGRYGGLNRSVKAAHADAFNTRTFGISILGNYDKVAPTSAGLWALKQGIAMRLSQFYINPYGRTTLYAEYSGTTSRYPKGAAYWAKNVAAHRESSYTACPGQYLYPKMGELTSGAANLAGWTSSGYSSPIYKHWMGTGGAGKWGYVTLGEGTKGVQMKRTVFTTGWRMYQSWAGVRAMRYGIDNAYWSWGGQDRFGVPYRDEVTVPRGSYVTFSKAADITRTSTGSAAVVAGGLRSYWYRTGGATSSFLGFPRYNGYTVPGGWAQTFERGAVFARLDGRTFHSEGALLAAYNTRGSARGALGMPRSNPVATDTGATQFFDGGVIRWDRATGRTTVSLG